MFHTRAITVVASAALLFSIALPQDASAGELGSFLRALKDQGKQALRNQLNTMINGAVPGGSNGTAYGSAPEYGNTPTYGGSPNYGGDPAYSSAPEYNAQAPSNGYVAPTSGNPYPSSSQAAPLDPSIYEAPGSTAAAPTHSYSASPAPHLTPGPVINGFGSRRASIH